MIIRSEVKERKKERKREREKKSCSSTETVKRAVVTSQCTRAVRVSPRRPVRVWQWILTLDDFLNKSQCVVEINMIDDGVTMRAWLLHCEQVREIFFQIFSWP